MASGKRKTKMNRHHDEIIYIPPKNRAHENTTALMLGIVIGAAGLFIINIIFGVQL
jgi:hypothetical protein